MRCYSCGEDEMEVVKTDCIMEDGEFGRFMVCRNCDNGINEHTEGECDCEKG